MAAPHPELGRLLSAVRRAPAGPVLVLGDVDSGKTRLVQDLAAALADDGPVLVADADPGQSWIGPPTTLGRALLARPPADWARLRPERLFFVGDTSPAANLRLMISTLGRLVAEGVEPGFRVLADTPGLAVGSLAEAFWLAVTERARPAAVIALERRGELEPVLRLIRDAGVPITKCAPAPGVRRRDTQERAAFRQAAYARYFRTARLRWAGRARLNVTVAAPQAGDSLDLGRLACLAAGRRDLGLGVLSAVGPKRLGLVTPLVSLAGVTDLRLGGLWVDPKTGRETRSPDAL